MKTTVCTLPSYSCSCVSAAPVFWEKVDPTCPYQVNSKTKCLLEQILFIFLGDIGVQNLAIEV